MTLIRLVSPSLEIGDFWLANEISDLVTASKLWNVARWIAGRVWDACIEFAQLVAIYAAHAPSPTEFIDSDFEPDPMEDDPWRPDSIKKTGCLTPKIRMLRTTMGRHEIPAW